MLKPTVLLMAAMMTLAGCAAPRVNPAASLNQPANPHADESPAFPESHTLTVTYSTSPASPLPPATNESMRTPGQADEPMQHMHPEAPHTKEKDHGAMDADHGMNSMDGMKGMDGMDMNMGQPMPDMDQSRKPSSQPTAHGRHE